MKIEKLLYTAEATATGGRNGHSQTSDGVISVDLAMPKTMGGTGAAGKTNPEQLFATGYSACFGSAVEYVAHLKKVKITTVSVTAKIGIGTIAGGGFALTAALAVKLPGVDRKVAEEIVAQAHTVCPYSNAIRGNVDVELSVID